MTDVGDTFDSMDTFNTSCIIPKTPSPKKSSKKFPLSRMIRSGSSEKNKSGKVEDKRLKTLKVENVSMVSSPSMLMPKKDLTPNILTSTPTEKEKNFEEALNEVHYDDTFDKMVNEETAEKSNENIESKSVTMEELPSIKEVSVELPKVNTDIVKYFKESQNNLRQAVDGIKSIK